MISSSFKDLLNSELSRLQTSGVNKRDEKIISGFSPDSQHLAHIGDNFYHIFNSNDYLGLRFHPQVLAAEHTGSSQFGAGPGAVRFISGTLSVHKNLEKALAKFHGRDDAIVFSSAFAANLAVISSLIKGQSKDSLVSANTLVVSDELNHRSIVEGIRVANLPDTQRRVFPHFDSSSLEKILSENSGKFDRLLLVTDGVFSMLGEYQDLKTLRQLADKYSPQYPQGIVLYVDDCHGIGSFGPTGRGVEELCSAASDVLIGTLGKAFGTDGGYVVADQSVIDYLRESAATYIYSNSISPGTASAALASVNLVDSSTGLKLLSQLRENITLFVSLINQTKFKLAAKSSHAIQPLLIGETLQTKKLENFLFQSGFLVTSITYPVVPKGRDEIRVQLSSAHTKEELENFVSTLTKFS